MILFVPLCVGTTNVFRYGGVLVDFNCVANLNSKEHKITHQTVLHSTVHLSFFDLR